MPSSPSRLVSALTHKRWFQRTLFGFGVFLLLFGLFAYFALPGIIKSQAEKLVAEKLHRQLSIERIDINPYALAADIHGVKLFEADGKTTFVAFDRLYVNVTLQSLFRLAPVVEEARLEKPYVHLVRTGANHYNFDDIVALIASQPPSPPSQGPARFAAYNLQLEDGHIEFDDLPAKTRHVVSELKLGVPFVSSLPSQVDVFVEPLFSAKINGSPLQLKGKARPFAASPEAAVNLDLDDVDLTRYVEYLPFKPQFKLPSAKLDVHLTAAFRQPKDKSPLLALKGTTALKSLQLTELNGKPMIDLPQLTVTLDDLNPLSSTLAIARIDIDHPVINVNKNADGKLNLDRLSPPATVAPGKSVAKPADKPETPATGPGLQLTLGKLSIRGAQANYSDAQGLQPLHAGVDKFDLKLDRLALDLQKQTVSVAAVTSSSADFSLVHDKAIPQAIARPSPAAEARKPATGASPGYVFSIEKIAVDNWSAHLEDRSLPQAAITNVKAVTLDAESLSNAPDKRGKLNLKAQVNQKGRLAVTGEIGIAPLHTDLTLDLQAVDLMPLQPFVTNKVNLLLTRAALSTKAALKLDEAGDGSLKGGVVGDFSVSDLATVDKLSSNDFLRWKSLAFSGVNVQLAPLSVSINQIALDDFFARIIVDPSGRINLQDIARRDGDEQKSLTETSENAAGSTTTSAPNSQATPAATPASGAGKSAQANTGPPTAPSIPPIKIRKVALKGGRVRFSDNFIKPNYSANLMDMHGAVNNLSSDATALAGVDLHGQVNSAPLNIVGSVNPLSGNLFLDLKADVRGMELAPLSPYSGKYIGYGIEKGRLSFEVAYHLQDRKLEAQNRVILDQLTLGEKVESPSALSLPIQLALTLLSDRNGVIDINLPIGGSLDDPQFSVGGIIVRVVVNLITKAVTAPFALLGSMFGGGEELSWLEFDPGRHAVPAAGDTKLNALAKALDDRPALKLEITGRYDPQIDRDGLRRAGIERKVRALKLKQMVSKGESADMNAVTITPEEYPALLTKVYKDEDFSKPRNLIGLQKEPPVEEMEKLMMANAKVSDDDMVTLGNQRAQAVKDWLIKNGSVAADRIFIVAAKPGNSEANSGNGSGDGNGKAKPSRVDFSLR